MKFLALKPSICAAGSGKASLRMQDGEMEELRFFTVDEIDLDEDFTADKKGNGGVCSEIWI